MREQVRACVVAVLVGVLETACSGDKSTSATDVVPPAEPTGLRVDRAGDGEVPLSWSPNNESDLLGYRLYRSEDMGQTYVHLRDVSAPSHMDVGLSYETTYYYMVSAYDTHGNESPPCSPVFARPRNTSPPVPPQDLRAIAHHLQTRAVLEIALTWVANTESDLMGYKLYKALTEEFQPGPETFLADTTEVYYVDTDVEVGKMYHYLVVAYDKEPLESAPSNCASDIPLETPVLLSPQDGAVTHTLPIFVWQPVLGAKSYRVILTTSPEVGEIWDVTTADTRLPYSAGPVLVSGTRYYWRVGTITNLPGDINSISTARCFTAR